MLTQTSESAVRALVYLVLYGGDQPTPPHVIAEHLNASPSYFAKITRMLVKANILRSHRGALGGVTLSRPPAEITLLNIVEACQGLLVGNYCQSMKDHPGPVCAFHTAMVEVQQATLGVLGKWTLKELSDQPGPGDATAIAALKCKIGLCRPEGPVNGCRPNRLRGLRAGGGNT